MQETAASDQGAQKKYGKDRQRMALEMQKLQKEQRVQPVDGLPSGACPAAVFLGSITCCVVQPNSDRGVRRQLRPHLSVGAEPGDRKLHLQPVDVGHFLMRNLFGAPLGASMTQSRGLDAFTEFSAGQSSE